jgi:hypothetical protein
LRRDRGIVRREGTLDALRWQSNGKGAALAAFARDLDLGLVAQQHVLDASGSLLPAVIRTRAKCCAKGCG